MGIPASHPESPRAAPHHPGEKRRHQDLQQQCGVSGQRDQAGKRAERDRLRQSQADVQSDAI